MDICILDVSDVLFCTLADFYEITNVKLFDIQSCQPDRLHFPCYDYDYLLVNKKFKNTFTGKIIHVNVFFYTKLK
jgi:hypothetical protein